MGNPIRDIARVIERPSAAIVFSLAVKFIEFVLLAPLGAATLRAFLERWGRVSVGNFEIAAFLLSPPGVLALVTSVGLVFASLYLEIAGVMRLLADRSVSWGRSLAHVTVRFPQLLALGVIQAAAYLILAIPFLAGVGLVAVVFWSGRDPNSLLLLRPPGFWIGAVVALLFILGYTILAGRLFIRWIFALPILLFETASVSRSLRISADRTRGKVWSLVGSVAAWVILIAALNAAVLAVLGWGAEWLLDRIGTSFVVAVPITAGVLLIQLAAVTLLSVVGSLTLAAVVLARYEASAGRVVASVGDPVPAANIPFRRWIPYACLGVFAVVAWQSYALVRGVRLVDALEITAHRAGAIRAPENTIAALNRAIADGADWAEIDVMLTGDGALIVTHDFDLSWSGGGTKRVRDATLAEIQALDVGSRFGPRFAGERIPTFEELLTAAGDRIRLNVELKPHGADGVKSLTEKVLASILAADMVERCRICSQSYEALKLAKSLEPRIPVGFIAGASLGDLTGLEVDFLMVEARKATRSLTNRAATYGMAVHAWTVNNPDALASLIDNGVVNVITDDPAALLARLAEIRELDTVERVILRVRNAIVN